MFSLEEGKFLVKIARRSIEKFFERNKIEVEVIDKFSKKRGVFVTIHTYPNYELRGCIGFPYPEYPIYEAVQRAAVEAAFNDPRFPPLKKEELNNVVFEVSILTEPKLIEVKNPKEYLERIEAGKDGIVIEYGFYKALFLPQVWEVLPEKEEFLSNLCLKAGLMPDCWLSEKVKMYKFRVQAFEEIKPKGEVREVKI